MSPRRHVLRPALAAIAALSLVAGSGVAYAAFFAATSASMTQATAVTFPTHPQTVGELSPSFYHRMDDPPYHGTTWLVKDSSPNDRTGTYYGVAAGSALHWAFDEADAASLSTADVSGNVNKGTFAPSAAREAASVTTGPTDGQVGVFDGTRAVTSARGAVPGSQPFTVSAWVRLTDGSVDRNVISQYGTAGNRFGLMYSAGSGGKWLFVMADADGGTAQYAVSATAAALNTWTHLLGTWDGSSMQLQVNKDKRVSTAHAPAWSATGLLTVGARETPGGIVDHWVGQIDRVHVFPYFMSVTNADSLVDSPNVLSSFGLGSPGVLPGSTGAAFTGQSNVSNNTLWSPPQTFSYSFWFRTTTTRGGYLVGFGDQQYDASSAYDRIVYLTPQGRVSFGVHDDVARFAVKTVDTYNDGQWHHVAATFTSGSMRLYVDGELRAERTDVTKAQSFNGYFRMGYDRLDGWTSAPSGDWPYVGGLDEFAVFRSVLSAQDVAQLYWSKF